MIPGNRKFARARARALCKTSWKSYTLKFSKFLQFLRIGVGRLPNHFQESVYRFSRSGRYPLQSSRARGHHKLNELALNCRGGLASCKARWTALGADESRDDVTNPHIMHFTNSWAVQPTHRSAQTLRVTCQTFCENR